MNRCSKARRRGAIVTVGIICGLMIVLAGCGSNATTSATDANSNVAAGVAASATAQAQIAAAAQGKAHSAPPQHAGNGPVEPVNH